MEQVNNKVLYFHINPLKNEIFYVGIGNKSRAYKKIGRNIFWNNTVKKYGLIVDIVEENLSIEQSKELEIFYINKIGRRDLGKGPLVNLTDGGDGITNYIVTEETKKKISESSLGKKMSDEAKLKMSISKSNMSDETKLKMSESATGKVVCDETKQKMSISQTGRKHSDETKLKMTGIIRSEETKLKMSDSKKGHIVSEETRKKISETQIGRKASEEAKNNMRIARQKYLLKIKQLKDDNE